MGSNPAAPTISLKSKICRFSGWHHLLPALIAITIFPISSFGLGNGENMKSLAPALVLCALALSGCAEIKKQTAALGTAMQEALGGCPSSEYKRQGLTPRPGLVRDSVMKPMKVELASSLCAVTETSQEACNNALEFAVISTGLKMAEPEARRGTYSTFSCDYDIGNLGLEKQFRVRFSPQQLFEGRLPVSVGDFWVSKATVKTTCVVRDHRRRVVYRMTQTDDEETAFQLVEPGVPVDPLELGLAKAQMVLSTIAFSTYGVAKDYRYSHCG